MDGIGARSVRPVAAARRLTGSPRSPRRTTAARGRRGHLPAALTCVQGLRLKVYPHFIFFKSDMFQPKSR